MQFTSERRLDDGVIERAFTLGEIPGTLWTPESAAPAPLILMAHNNGLPKRQPRAGPRRPPPGDAVEALGAALNQLPTASESAGARGAET